MPLPASALSRADMGLASQYGQAQMRTNVLPVACKRVVCRCRRQVVSQATQVLQAGVLTIC